MHFLADTTAPSQYSSLDWVVLAMVMMAITYLLLRSNAKRRRDPLDAPRGMSLAQQRATERQMESLLVDLSEMARQISSQLDTRAAKLETLLREADEKIDQLRSAQQGRPSKSAPVEDDRPPMRLVPPEPAAIDPRHADVYRLADQGQSPSQIADRLNRPSGEIELILALRAR
jgi:hypothetical protein